MPYFPIIYIMSNNISWIIPHFENCSSNKLFVSYPYFSKNQSIIFTIHRLPAKSGMYIIFPTANRNISNTFHFRFWDYRLDIFRFQVYSLYLNSQRGLIEPHLSAESHFWKRSTIVHLFFFGFIYIRCTNLKSKLQILLQLPFVSWEKYINCM